MNIFFLSDEPNEAAKMACDRHSIKMILESAQMLSTVLRQHGYDESKHEDLDPRFEKWIYGITHAKHPSTIWSGKTSELKKSNHPEVKHFIKPFATST